MCLHKAYHFLSQYCWHSGLWSWGHSWSPSYRIYQTYHNKSLEKLCELCPIFLLSFIARFLVLSDKCNRRPDISEELQAPGDTSHTYRQSG
jgi:hypothetical protein